MQRLRKYFLLPLLITTFLWSAGCSNRMVSIHSPDVGEEATHLYQPSVENGSLWPKNADKFGLFGDAKASKVGDIVTISIAESSTASQEATTSTSKDASQDMSVSNIFGLGSDLGISDFLGSKRPFNPRLQTGNKNAFKGAGSTSRKANLITTMTALIKQVLPSGNFRIEGKRLVQVNNETQTLLLTGIIRPEDIGYQNTISSTLIADAKIYYSGRGVIAEKQRVGWGTRILDYIWPF